MARGTTLQILVHKLRAETGRSVSLAMGAPELDHLKQVIQRTQEELYDNHDWEFLSIVRDESLAASSRYYSLDSDLSFENVTSVQVQPSSGDQWYPVTYGITERHYNITDSSAGETEDWVTHWDFYEGGQYEVWPMPATANQTLRFRGKKNLSALVADNDTADLDDQMIVLFAAAELLADVDQNRAALKLEKAQKRKDSLLGKQHKRPPINLARAEQFRHTPRYPKYGRRIS